MLDSLNVSGTTPYRDLAFEWVTATASFSVDPWHRANSSIRDLPLAPRDGDGRVHFEADVRLLRPSDGGNGKVLVVVPNRGMHGGVPFSLDVPAAMFSADAPDPGDAFLLREGWAIAWCGWQWDVDRSAGWLGLTAPVVQVDPGWLRLEFRPDTDQLDHPLSDSGLFSFQDYPTADVDDAEATLSVRTSPSGEKTLLPRSSWRFSTETRIELETGFRAFHWYELAYRSSFAPVVGVGLLAFRDLAASLRHEADRLFAFGISQSGRFLRQFLFDGLNLDEEGHQVFDGMFTHIAGARRGEFNCRFGQPSLTHPMTAPYGPPYDAAGLLARQRSLGGVPKMVATNSAAEYWRGDAALLHQDPRTGEDLVEDPEVRNYLISGTDHLGSSDLKAWMPVANPVHLLDPGPVLRAVFTALDRWVGDDVPPPPSRTPRRSNASAVERPTVLAFFREGILPDPALLPANPVVDPDSTTIPLELGPATVSLVSAVDADGNEVAGIRLPAVAAPVFAYTGWNPRKPVAGLPDVLYEFAGSRVPLQAPLDLPDRAQYERRARAIAHDLVRDRLLLVADSERTVTEALKLFDSA